MVSRIKRFMKYPVLINFLGVMFFASIMLVSSMGYLYLKKSYIKSTVENLHSILDVIQNNISHYIEAEIQKVSRIAETANIIDFLQGKLAQADLIHFLQQNVENYENTPVVIFSSKHEPIFASDGQLTSYTHHEALQSSVQRSLIFCRPDVSDFSANLVQNDHKLFITVSVVRGEFLGSLAIALSTKQITNLIANYYPNLGKSGEIIVAKKIQDHVVTLFPTRFNPQAAFNTQISYSIGLQKAVDGERGTFLIAPDYLKQKSILIWQYLPLTAWGLEIKIAYDEVMRSLLVVKLFVLFLVLLSFLGLLYCFHQMWKHIKEKRREDLVVSKFFICLLYIFFIINSVVLVRVFVHYYQVKNINLQKHMEAFEISLQSAAQQIGRHVIALEITAHALAFDIGNEVLDASVLQARVESDMKDNTDIANIIIASQENKKWNMKSFASHKSPEIPELQQALFKRALDQAASWVLLPNQEGSDGWDLIYFSPFYEKQDSEHKKAIGVVGVVFAKNSLLSVAHEQMGAERSLAILDTARRLIYQDKGFAQQYSVAELSTGMAHLEKIPYLGWYLGSNVPAMSFWGFDFIRLCLGIIVSLCILIIITYRLMHCCNIQLAEKKYKKLLGTTFLVIVALTCLQYLMLR